MAIEQIALKASEEDFKKENPLNDKINIDEYYNNLSRKTISLKKQLLISNILFKGEDGVERFRYKEIIAMIDLTIANIVFKVELDGQEQLLTDDLWFAIEKYNKLR